MALKPTRIHTLDQFIDVLEGMGVNLARGVLRRKVQEGDLDDFLTALLQMAQNEADAQRRQYEQLRGPIRPEDVAEQRMERNQLARRAARMSKGG